MALEVGQPAPEFSLSDSDGHSHSLADYRGRYVVLYFYPRDDTPGCTKQACSFRDNLPHFSNLNAVVLGVSTDGVESHRRFAEKYGLPFTLLADESHAVNEAYGVWKERSMAGKTFMGTERTTFLIDPEGHIARIWEKANAEQNPTEVLAALGG